MNIKTDWHDYDEGFSIGTVGADAGAIVRDEEHKYGARITLEEEGSSAPFTLTCTIYGWMFHARYFSEESEAENEFELMKKDLTEILKLIFDENSDESFENHIQEEIDLFVEKYP